MYSLFVSSDTSQGIKAFTGVTVSQCVRVARSCYGKGVYCQTVNNDTGAVVKQWRLSGKSALCN